MSNFPDFSELGYQVERELGQNRASSRVTYLATKTNTQLPVGVNLVKANLENANLEGELNLCRTNKS